MFNLLVNHRKICYIDFKKQKENNEKQLTTECLVTMWWPLLVRLAKLHLSTHQKQEQQACKLWHYITIFSNMSHILHFWYFRA